MKVLEGYSFKDKTSSTIVKAIISLVLKFNIENKVLRMIFFFTVCVIYFYNDNMNTNFGGAQCHGKSCILIKLKNL